MLIFRGRNTFWKIKSIRFNSSEARQHQVNTWLWGWENVNGFSEKIIQVATHAKVVGETLEFRATNDSKFTLTIHSTGITCLS